MTHTITITRKGLVIERVRSERPAHERELDRLFIHTDELANQIDNRAVARRQSLAQPRTYEAAPFSPGRNYGPDSLGGSYSAKIQIDWFQKFIEGMLLLSFTSLLAVYLF